jgi:formylglycine-generating enzyme required for sulfatase activity
MSISDIHGWNKDQVVTWQQQQADSADCAVEFSDDWTAASLGDDAMAMVFIPAASYMMGAAVEKEGFDNELEHPMSVEKSCAVAKFLVTFTQYDEFARQTGRELPDDAGWGRGQLPVINVSWQDAGAFADWASEKTGQRYRLPTEAEWELAARAGSDTNYWWGDKQDHSMANGGMRRRIGMDRREMGLSEGDDWGDEGLVAEKEEAVARATGR